MDLPRHEYVVVSHWRDSTFHRYVNQQGGCRQIREATSNQSTALTSANELARTRALRPSLIGCLFNPL
jgi:hypothetical protein